MNTMNKKLLLPILIALVIIGAASYFSTHDNEKAEAQTGAAVVPSMPVTTQAASDSRTATTKLTYPGTVVADQETKLVAEASGNVASLRFALGQRVSAGASLATIDDTTSSVTPEDGFRSPAVQQAQIAEEIARKNAQQAKKDHATNTRTVRDIAKLQYESAQIATQDALDSHTIRAPFAGVITSRLIDRGESVSAGQTVATLSATGKINVDFFVSQEELRTVSIGQSVTIVPRQGNPFVTTVTRIAPAADPVTRRFLIEVDLGALRADVPTGTIVDVALSVTRTPEQSGDILVPLASITTGQNENYLFTADGGVARKRVVTVKKIAGEWAEIAGDLPSDARIIIDGSKRVQDGSPVSVK